MRDGAVGAGWLPMAVAAKEAGYRIWALFKPDMAALHGRADLERWQGLEAPIMHPGVADDGFDVGWSIALPVGHGGFPDEWFVGWRPLASEAIQSELRTPVVRMVYTNWREETELRRVQPKQIWWGSTRWHPEPGWTMRAFDCDRRADRDFALAQTDFADVETWAKGLTARREHGAHHDPEIARGYGGNWVVRDAKGRFVAWGQYRNDLQARFPSLTVIED